MVESSVEAREAIPPTPTGLAPEDAGLGMSSLKLSDAQLAKAKASLKAKSAPSAKKRAESEPATEKAERNSRRKRTAEVALAGPSTKTARAETEPEERLDMQPPRRSPLPVAAGEPDIDLEKLTEGLDSEGVCRQLTIAAAFVAMEGCVKRRALRDLGEAKEALRTSQLRVSANATEIAALKKDLSTVSEEKAQIARALEETEREKREVLDSLPQKAEQAVLEYRCSEAFVEDAAVLNTIALQTAYETCLETLQERGMSEAAAVVAELLEDVKAADERMAATPGNGSPPAE